MNNARLAYLRFIRRGSKIGIVCVFVFLIQCSQFLTAAILPVLQAESVTDELSRFTGDDRWLTVTLGDSSLLGTGEKSNQALAALARLTRDTPLHFVAYRPVSDKAFGRYQLVGVDQIATQVKMVSGRLPALCTPSRCEALLINAVAQPKLPENVSITGTAALGSNSPLWSALDKASPVLLANSAAEVAALPDFLGFPATESWATPLKSHTIAAVGLTKFLEGANDVSNQLSILSGRLKLVAPFAKLEAIQNQTDVLQRRFASLGFGVCIIGTFAMYLVARSGRQRHLSFLLSAKRLQSHRFSATRTTSCLALIFSGLSTLLALIVGWVLLMLFGGGLTPHLLPATHLTAMFASAIAIFAGLQTSRRTRRLLTLLVAILWLIQAITQSLDPQLSLIAFVAAALTTLVVRVFHRFQSNLWVKSSRRASAQWIRAIGVGTAFIAALLLASQGLLSTLQLGASDNAVYNSPTATRIKRGGEATVMENNSVADYQRITQTLKVFPVRKISATVREGALKSAPTLLVGVDPQVWKSVPDIRHQTILDLRSTGALLSEPKARFGVDASSANSFDVKVSGLHPNTYLSVWVLNSRSESELVRLNPNGQRLSARLPEGTDRILGFEITEFPDFKDRREHAVGEGINGLTVPTGSITLASLQLDGQMVEGPAIDQRKYSLINGPVFLSLVDLPMSIPAIVDEDTAALAEGETVWVNIGVDTAVELNVVGRSHNLPTVPMRFALLNPNVLTQLLAATHPEMIRVSEIWSTQSPPNSSENRKSLDGLSILSRSDVLINNHTPTTARWTQRGFGLLWTSLVLMYIVLVIFAATAIFSDPQILGWHGAGVSLQHITRALAVFVFAQVCIGLVAAFAIVKMFLPLLVTLQTYDLNGVEAYPSLVVQWNWFEIFASCAGVVLISIFAIQIAVQRTRAVGRVEK